MTAADLTDLEVLLGSIWASVGEIAKQQVMLFVRLDHIEIRIDRLEHQLEQILLRSQRSIQLLSIDARLFMIDVKLDMLTAKAKGRPKRIDERFRAPRETRAASAR